MADDQDESEKTEEPTQRRLEDAFNKGQVPNSREISSLFLLTVFALVIAWTGPYTAGQILKWFSHFIQAPHDIEVSADSAPLLFADMISHFTISILPIAIMSVAAALLSQLIQHPPLFTVEPIMPKLEKLSPISGLKRMFSLRSFLEFFKGILKISVVGLIAFLVLWPERRSLEIMSSLSILGLLTYLQSIALKIVIGVLSFVFVIAVFDFIMTRFEHVKKLRMSRRDIKEEFKQSEGDPQIKARLRQIRMERARTRMMSAVPEADVVVTNPTHFAVALKYSEGVMEAPVLVAKGMDNIALKIREVAKENNVPIVENPPLARGLFDAVELDQEIPLEFYQAVAEVISYVYRTKGKAAA